MNTRHLLIGFAACCTQWVAAQSVEPMALTGIEPLRNRLETSLKGYLVAFDSQLAKERVRVGVPLASFANDQIKVAYDLSGQNVMAQWQFAQSNTGALRLNYHAYVGASGGISLVLRSNF